MRSARAPLALALALSLLAALLGSGACAAAVRRCCCRPPAETVALCKASCCVQAGLKHVHGVESAEAWLLVDGAVARASDRLGPPRPYHVANCIEHAPAPSIGDGPAFRLRV